MKYVSVFCALALAASLLSGCGEAPEVPAESLVPAPPPESVSAPAPQSVPVTPGTPGEEYQGLQDLLTLEQRDLYQQALDSSVYLLGDPVELCSSGTGCGNSYGEPVDLSDLYEDAWGSYVLVEGRDRDYAAFKARMLDIYTPEYLDQISFDVMFKDYHGQLAVSGAARCGVWGADSTLDTYRPVSSTDDEVRFIVVGHYFDPRDGESDEAFIARRDRGEFDRTCDIPVRMVRTADGWRVDEFSTTGHSMPDAGAQDPLY